VRTCIPEGIITTGKTGLPILTLPQVHVNGDQVGPLRIFYNLAPKQFRLVDDSNPKYEHRCGSAWELLAEVENLLDRELPDPPAEISELE
jgi:hypothetical protein